MELWAERLEDDLALLATEVGRERLDGLDVVEALDPGVFASGRRCELENGPRLIADDLNLSARVRSQVLSG